MQPNQPSQPHPPAGPGPQPPYHQPEYTIDPNIQSDRHAFGAPQSRDFQQHPSGTYEVVPPIPAMPNTGGSGHNPYEFIVAANAKPKPNLLSSLSGKSFMMRIGILAGGAVVLVIIVAVVVSLLAPKGNGPALTLVAERQQEIVRVSKAASHQVTGQDADNFVLNVNLTTTSCQNQIIGYLAERKTKIPPKTLALDVNAKTDTLLANAASAGTYDTVAAQILAEQLQTYQDLLRTTYQQISGNIARQMLQDCSTSNTNLLKQYQTLSGKSS